jgi:hypothetical protein
MAMTSRLMAATEYDLPDDLADRVTEYMEANDDVSWVTAFESVMAAHDGDD